MHKNQAGQFLLVNIMTDKQLLTDLSVDFEPFGINLGYKGFNFTLLSQSLTLMTLKPWWILLLLVKTDNVNDVQLELPLFLSFYSC